MHRPGARRKVDETKIRNYTPKPTGRTLRESEFYRRFYDKKKERKFPVYSESSADSLEVYKARRQKSHAGPPPRPPPAHKLRHLLSASEAPSPPRRTSKDLRRSSGPPSPLRPINRPRRRSPSGPPSPPRPTSRDRRRESFSWDAVFPLYPTTHGDRRRKSSNQPFPSPLTPKERRPKSSGQPLLSLPISRERHRKSSHLFRPRLTDRSLFLKHSTTVHKKSPSKPRHTDAEQHTPPLALETPFKMKSYSSSSSESSLYSYSSYPSFQHMIHPSVPIFIPKPLMRREIKIIFRRGFRPDQLSMDSQVCYVPLPATLHESEKAARLLQEKARLAKEKAVEEEEGEEKDASKEKKEGAKKGGKEGEKKEEAKEEGKKAKKVEKGTKEEVKEGAKEGEKKEGKEGEKKEGKEGEKEEEEEEEESEPEDIENVIFLYNNVTPMDFLRRLGFNVEEASIALKKDETKRRLRAALDEARIWVNHLTAMQGTLILFLCQVVKTQVMRYFLQIVEGIVNNRISNASEIDGFITVLNRIEDGTLKLTGKLEPMEELPWSDSISVSTKKAFTMHRYIQLYNIARAESYNIRGLRHLKDSEIQLLKYLTLRFRQSIQNHAPLLARYIGQGKLRTRMQLDAALVYATRDQDIDIDIDDFESFCGIGGQTDIPRKILQVEDWLMHDWDEWNSDDWDEYITGTHQWREHEICIRKAVPGGTPPLSQDLSDEEAKGLIHKEADKVKSSTAIPIPTTAPTQPPAEDKATPSETAISEVELQTTDLTEGDKGIDIPVQETETKITIAESLGTAVESAAQTAPDTLLTGMLIDSMSEHIDPTKAIPESFSRREVHIEYQGSIPKKLLISEVVRPTDAKGRIESRSTQTKEPGIILKTLIEIQATIQGRDETPNKTITTPFIAADSKPPETGKRSQNTQTDISAINVLLFNSPTTEPESNAATITARVPDNVTKTATVSQNTQTRISSSDTKTFRRNAPVKKIESASSSNAIVIVTDAPIKLIGSKTALTILATAKSSEDDSIRYKRDQKRKHRKKMKVPKLTTKLLFDDNGSVSSDLSERRHYPHPRMERVGPTTDTIMAIESPESESDNCCKEVHTCPSHFMQRPIVRHKRTYQTFYALHHDVNYKRSRRVSRVKSIKSSHIPITKVITYYENLHVSCISSLNVMCPANMNEMESKCISVSNKETNYTGSLFHIHKLPILTSERQRLTYKANSNILEAITQKEPPPPTVDCNKFAKYGEYIGFLRGQGSETTKNRRESEEDITKTEHARITKSDIPIASSMEHLFGDDIKLFNDIPRNISLDQFSSSAACFFFSHISREKSKLEFCNRTLSTLLSSEEKTESTKAGTKKKIRNSGNPQVQRSNIVTSQSTESVYPGSTTSSYHESESSGTKSTYAKDLLPGYNTGRERKCLLYDTVKGKNNRSKQYITKAKDYERGSNKKDTRKATFISTENTKEGKRLARDNVDEECEENIQTMVEKIPQVSHKESTTSRKLTKHINDNGNLSHENCIEGYAMADRQEVGSHRETPKNEMFSRIIRCLRDRKEFTPRHHDKQERGNKESHTFDVNVIYDFRNKTNELDIQTIQGPNFERKNLRNTTVSKKVKNASQNPEFEHNIYYSKDLSEIYKKGKLNSTPMHALSHPLARQSDENKSRVSQKNDVHTQSKPKDQEVQVTAPGEKKPPCKALENTVDNLKRRKEKRHTSENNKTRKRKDRETKESETSIAITIDGMPHSICTARQFDRDRHISQEKVREMGSTTNTRTYQVPRHENKTHRHKATSQKIKKTTELKGLKQHKGEIMDAIYSFTAHTISPPKEISIPSHMVGYKAVLNIGDQDSLDGHTIQGQMEKTHNLRRKGGTHKIHNKTNVVVKPQRTKRLSQDTSRSRDKNIAQRRKEKETMDHTATAHAVTTSTGVRRAVGDRHVPITNDRHGPVAQNVKQSKETTVNRTKHHCDRELQVSEYKKEIHGNYKIDQKRRTPNNATTDKEAPKRTIGSRSDKKRYILCGNIDDENDEAHAQKDKWGEIKESNKTVFNEVENEKNKQEETQNLSVNREGRGVDSQNKEGRIPITKVLSPKDRKKTLPKKNNTTSLKVCSHKYWKSGKHKFQGFRRGRGKSRSKAISNPVEKMKKKKMRKYRMHTSDNSRSKKDTDVSKKELLQEDTEYAKTYSVLFERQTDEVVHNALNDRHDKGRTMRKIQKDRKQKLMGRKHRSSTPSNTEETQKNDIGIEQLSKENGKGGEENFTKIIEKRSASSETARAISHSHNLKKKGEYSHKKNADKNNKVSNKTAQMGEIQKSPTPRNILVNKIENARIEGDHPQSNNNHPKSGRKKDSQEGTAPSTSAQDASHFSHSARLPEQKKDDKTFDVSSLKIIQPENKKVQHVRKGSAKDTDKGIAYKATAKTRKAGLNENKNTLPHGNEKEMEKNKEVATPYADTFRDVIDADGASEDGVTNSDISHDDFGQEFFKSNNNNVRTKGSKKVKHTQRAFSKEENIKQTKESSQRIHDAQDKNKEDSENKKTSINSITLRPMSASNSDKETCDKAENHIAKQEQPLNQKYQESREEIKNAQKITSKIVRSVKQNKLLSKHKEDNTDSGAKGSRKDEESTHRAPTKHPLVEPFHEPGSSTDENDLPDICADNSIMPCIQNLQVTTKKKEDGQNKDKGHGDIKLGEKHSLNTKKRYNKKTNDDLAKYAISGIQELQMGTEQKVKGRKIVRNSPLTVKQTTKTTTRKEQMKSNSLSTTYSKNNVLGTIQVDQDTANNIECEHNKEKESLSSDTTCALPFSTTQRKRNSKMRFAYPQDVIDINITSDIRDQDISTNHEEDHVQKNKTSFADMTKTDSRSTRRQKENNRHDKSPDNNIAENYVTWDTERQQHLSIRKEEDDIEKGIMPHSVPSSSASHASNSKWEEKTRPDDSADYYAENYITFNNERESDTSTNREDDLSEKEVSPYSVSSSSATHENTDGEREEKQPQDESSDHNDENYIHIERERKTSMNREENRFEKEISPSSVSSSSASHASSDGKREENETRDDSSDGNAENYIKLHTERERKTSMNRYEDHSEKEILRYSGTSSSALHARSNGKWEEEKRRDDPPKYYSEKKRTSGTENDMKTEKYDIVKKITPFFYTSSSTTHTSSNGKQKERKRHDDSPNYYALNYIAADTESGEDTSMKTEEYNIVKNITPYSDTSSATTHSSSNGKRKGKKRYFKSPHCYALNYLAADTESDRDMSMKTDEFDIMKKITRYSDTSSSATHSIRTVKRKQKNRYDCSRNLDDTHTMSEIQKDKDASMKRERYHTEQFASYPDTRSAETNQISIRKRKGKNVCVYPPDNNDDNYIRPKTHRHVDIAINKERKYIEAEGVSYSDGRPTETHASGTRKRKEKTEKRSTSNQNEPAYFTKHSPYSGTRRRVMHSSNTKKWKEQKMYDDPLDNYGDKYVTSNCREVLDEPRSNSPANYADKYDTWEFEGEKGASKEGKVTPSKGASPEYANKKQTLSYSIGKKERNKKMIYDSRDSYVDSTMSSKIQKGQEQIHHLREQLVYTVNAQVGFSCNGRLHQRDTEKCKYVTGKTKVRVNHNEDTTSYRKPVSYNDYCNYDTRNPSVHGYFDRYNAKRDVKHVYSKFSPEKARKDIRKLGSNSGKYTDEQVKSSSGARQLTRHAMLHSRKAHLNTERHNAGSKNFSRQGQIENTNTCECDNAIPPSIYVSRMSYDTAPLTGYGQTDAHVSVTGRDRYDENAEVGRNGTKQRTGDMRPRSSYAEDRCNNTDHLSYYNEHRRSDGRPHTSYTENRNKNASNSYDLDLRREVMPNRNVAEGRSGPSRLPSSRRRKPEEKREDRRAPSRVSNCTLA